VHRTAAAGVNGTSAALEVNGYRIRHLDQHSQGVASQQGGGVGQKSLLCMSAAGV